MNRPTIKIKSVEGYIFSIDISFLKKCTNPEVESAYTLFNTFNMKPYLHNLYGPAINEQGYYLLGEALTRHNWELKSKDAKFSDKLNAMLED
jgi:hypothetical protein